MQSSQLSDSGERRSRSIAISHSTAAAPILNKFHCSLISCLCPHGERERERDKLETSSSCVGWLCDGGGGQINGVGKLKSATSRLGARAGAGAKMNIGYSIMEIGLKDKRHLEQENLHILSAYLPPDDAEPAQHHLLNINNAPRSISVGRPSVTTLNIHYLLCTSAPYRRARQCPRSTRSVPHPRLPTRRLPTAYLSVWVAGARIGGLGGAKRQGHHRDIFYPIIGI